LSKRKTGALRTKENTSKYTQFPSNDTKTFYINHSKTIDFSQAQPKTKQRKQVDLLPKSLNQEKYIVALLDENVDIVVVSGPAGTGKTYLAMLAAIKALRSGECSQIILTRPAVSVDDEKHGFLPGDLTAKMEPWTRPLIDVLKEYYSVKEIQQMLEEQIIEIAPLAFCRGRNFKNSWVILDESQNATPSQLKMIMTRIGENSKIVITGDIEQTDRKAKDNGLLDIIDRLQTYPVPGLSICNFTVKDVQRHKIIEHILKLYQ
jgi:phosphate starvation-inducible PhoH-like protein